MSAIASSEFFSRVSRRGATWLVIGAVHLALIHVITSWSPVRFVFETTPIEASIVDVPKPLSDAPPPPLPQLEQPTLPVIDPPVVTINEEPAPRAITVAVAEQPAPPVAVPAAPAVVTEVAYIEPPQPRYPPESKRSGEEGLVVLRVLINEIGRAARIDVERSSGHARLDEAARQAVQRALFQPYLENGVPHMALARVPIEFSWKSRRAERSGRRG